MTGSFCSIYKRNSAEFSIEFSVFKILRFHGLQVFVFQIDLNISMSYKFLEGVSENRYTPKGKRRATFVMCSISGSRCDINNDIGRDLIILRTKSMRSISTAMLPIINIKHMAMVLVMGYFIMFRLSFI